MLIINTLKPFYIDKDSKIIRMGNFKNSAKEIEYEDDTLILLFESIKEPISKEDLIDKLKKETKLSSNEIDDAIEYLKQENFIIDYDNYTNIISDELLNRQKLFFSMASDKLKANVVKNDTGIMIDALGGFPAAYTHYVGDTIGEKGILKLMRGEENRKARFVQVLAYCEYGSEPVVFKSITEGSISKRLQGKYGWSWDFIFIPEGQEKTLGSFKDDVRLKMWNDNGYKQLIDYLKKNKKI